MALAITLEGRVAAITGASSGMGEAVARRLAARGAKVGLIARRADKLNSIATEINDAGGTVIALAADVTDVDALGEAAGEIQRVLGTTNIVFNNAGIMLPTPMQDRNTRNWDAQIDINVSGVTNTLAAFVGQLLAAATEGSPADLINMSSISARQVAPGFALYGATKAFITQLSLTLRAELGPKGVRVSSLEPGLVDTDLYKGVESEDMRAWFENAREEFRWLTNEDIADIVDFTVSLPASANLAQVLVLPTAQS